MNVKCFSLAVISPKIPPNLALAELDSIMPKKKFDVFSGPHAPPMTLSVLNLQGEKSNTEITLSNKVFGVPIRRDIVHNVIKWERAKKRCARARTKRMKDLRGSTRKLYRQKGTGKARVGMNRRAGRVGGMKAHGPVPRDFSFKLNKKVVRLGFRVALSAKLKEKSLFIVDKLDLEQPKTAFLDKKLQALNGRRLSLLMHEEEIPENFSRASGNLPYLKVLSTKEANVYDIIKHNHLILTVAAVEKLQYNFTERAA